MKLIQRGNKQLRVRSDQLEQYRATGYVEVDAVTGQPVAAPSAAADLALENGRLREENEALRAQLAAATAAADAAQPVVYACPHCGREYKTEKGLADHIVKEHAGADTPEE